MKIKAKSKNGIVQVKMLMKHNMDSGQAKDKKGNPIPAHYIEEVTIKHNGEEVMVAELGPAISKNPFLSFNFKGDKGGKITGMWVDNQGMTKSAETVVK